MTALLTLELPTVPSPPISKNEAHGMHWSQLRKRLDPWRDTTAWVAKSKRRQVHKLIADHGLPLVVRVTIPFEVERRRDAHNYTSTTCAKVVDGLQIAGWIRDDTPDWVEVADPLLVVGGLPKIELLAKGQGS